MICISINQESRRLALVDMFNAAPQCDLLEVRLDRFGMAPELGDMIAHKPRPVIMSCRRPQDGGYWDGSEAERLALLRQCIVHKPEFVEIELDAADEIRRLPPTRRVISYTNLKETPDDIVDIYAKMLKKKPDVIKLTCHARTPEEAWPLVRILAKPKVPTVVVGVGKAGVMLTVLGKKIGAPFTFAALEKGMEAYPFQPTVHELKTVYHYPAITKSTKLIGVTGFKKRERLTVAGLNAVFAHLELRARCLPLGVGSIPLFAQVVEACKLPGVVVDEAHQEAILEMASERHPTATVVGAADVILHKADHWHGFHTGAASVLAALATALKIPATEQALANRFVMIVGINPLAKTLARELTHRRAGVILASHQRKALQEAAKEIGCRQVQFEAIYSTMHDILLVCDEEKELGKGLHVGHFKPGLVVMDVTAKARMTPLLREAEARGCTLVAPRQRLLEQVEMQAKLFTSKPVPREVIAETLAAGLEDDE